MKLETFLRKFAKLAPKARWKLDGDGAIRTRDKVGHCPVTFLAEQLTFEGYRLPRAYVWEAGAMIGLATEDADIVSIAADNSFPPEDPDYVRVRRRLLKACNLKDC